MEIKETGRAPNELVDLAKEIPRQNAVSAVWLLSATNGKVQEEKVELNEGNTQI